MKPKDLTTQDVQEAYIATRKEPVNIQVQDEATALISQAIDKNVDVATMEKLLEMRKQLKAEKAKEAYDQAMANFQANCPTIEKKTKGYNYMYADLTSIVSQVRDLLAEYGFSYTFDTEEADNAVIVLCRVKHIAGHSETSRARIPQEATSKMNLSQQSGAAMTYGKRYAFCNAFGILTGDDDTDASTKNASEHRQVGSGGSVPSKGTAVVNRLPEPDEGSIKPITFKQKGDIIRLLGKLKKNAGDLDKLVKTQYDLDSYELLTIGQADSVIHFLEKRVAETDEQALDSEQIADEVAEGIDKEPKMSMTKPI